MKAHFEGRWIEMCEDWRAREQIEAENALGIDFFEATGFQKTLVILYMSVRQVTPETELPIHALADKVMNVEFQSFGEMQDDEEEGDARPPDLSSSGNGTQQTSGAQPSESTASPSPSATSE